MAALPTGKLPPRLVYIYSSVPQATEDETVVDGPALKWQPAIVRDATAPKPILTAERQYGVKARRWETDNLPIPHFELLGHHHYKKSSEFYVRVHDRFRVEIPESSFVDFLRHGRLGDGKMLGPFVWGTHRGQNMQLIRVGSLIYEQLVDAMDRKGGKTIHARNLEPGGFYAFWDRTRALYLGRVDYEQMDWGGNTKPVRGDHAWLSVPEEGSNPLLGSWHNNVRTHEKFRVVEKIGLSNCELPENLWRLVQIAQLTDVLDAESRHDAHARPYYGAQQYGPFNPEAYFWRSAVKRASIREAGTPLQRIEVPERFQAAYDRMCAEILNAKLPEKPKEAK